VGRAVLAVLAIGLLVPPSLGAAEIRDLVVSRTEEGLSVTLRLADAFPPEIQNRIQSGLEVAFQYTVRLRRKRGGFDKTVADREVVVSVQYSNLTKMYKVTRRIDGAVIDADVIDRPDAVRAWMTEISQLQLFGGRDLAGSGTYYVRVKASLLSRFKMLFIPWDLEAGWVEAQVGRIERVRR
jgi:hypothetical protein